MRSLILIDDDEAFLTVIKRRLLQTGLFTVTTHTSVSEALLQPVVAPTHGILLDMMLGSDSGLDGIDALKRHFHPTHLIMLTGYASIATSVEAMRRGATDYITKPIGFQELVLRFQDTPSLKEPPQAKPMTPAQVEWEHIQRILLSHDGNISVTAQALGMHRRTLQRKLQKFSPSKS
ncbi:MAG: two-component system response regulator [Alteromonadaceae bacterium]|jgi:two-component system response regulator RegA|nr:two-component system response regulator [Alteromonadaceae bacterium]MBB18847.1 two-component system response regulator [Rickettsiales bacterium]